MGDFLKGALTGALVSLLIFAVIHVMRVDQINAQVERANEVAREWVLNYDAALQAYEERALQLEGLRDSVEERNERLADRLERSQATVLSLQDQVVGLSARLDSSRTVAEEESPGTYRIDVDERVLLADGRGHIAVRGPITLTVPDAVRTDLGVEGSLPLSVVVSETAEGEIAVHAFTGDPRITVDSLDVSVRRPDAGATGGILSGIGEQLTGASPWVNRIGGAVLGRLSCGVF